MAVICKFDVVVPTLNEAGNIVTVLDRAWQALSGHAQKGLAGAITYGWKHSDADLIGVMEATSSIRRNGCPN